MLIYFCIYHLVCFKVQRYVLAVQHVKYRLYKAGTQAPPCISGKTTKHMQYQVSGVTNLLFTDLQLFS